MCSMPPNIRHTLQLSAGLGLGDEQSIGGWKKRGVSYGMWRFEGPAKDPDGERERRTVHCWTIHTWGPYTREIVALEKCLSGRAGRE